MIICGEALVDMVPATPGQFEAALGGGPFNVAISAARQGAQVDFVSHLSKDDFGTQLFDALKSEKVGTDYIQRGSEPTSLALTTLDQDHNASYNFYIAETADRFYEYQTPWKEPIDIACFGTMSLALDPGAGEYCRLAQELWEAGTIIALDPNIRPLYKNDEHREFLYRFLEHTDILKLSDEEDDFLGQPRAGVTIITQGADGLEIILKEQEETSLRIPGVSVEVADTIGAGDTIMGVLLAELQSILPKNQAREHLAKLDSDTWKRIGTRAAAAGALTVSRHGAKPPTRAELEEFLR